MLEETGIMTVPGSGFGQREGTYHFRVANLMTPTTRMELVLQIMRKFNNDFHAEWQ
jgi:alanine transaminase